MNALVTRLSHVAKAVTAVAIPIAYAAVVQIATDLSVSEDPLVAAVGLVLIGAGVYRVPNAAPAQAGP